MSEVHIKNRFDFPMIAREIVHQYARGHLDVTDGYDLKLEDVYLVWFSKTLQNWKAFVSTALPDGMYYEVTFSGNTGEAYLDAYKKFANVQIDVIA